MRHLYILLFLFTVLLGQQEVRASHIVGGEMYYNYLGGNNYRVYIILYRDCYSTGAAYDSPLKLGVFYNPSGALKEVVDVPFPGSNVLPIIFNNPCIVKPTNICTEKAVYTTVINLPPRAGGYTLGYQRCCRGPNVQNLVIPDDQGITLKVNIPGTESFPANGSPRFTNYPPLVICNNDQLVFDHSATDPDGDSLVYSLAAPYHGGSSGNPAPNPPSGPPYSNVVWSNGHNTQQPLGPGSSLSINPTTGLLTGQPNNTGLYVVGVQVEEFRNGVSLGKYVRDFLFVIINCQITMNAVLPEQEDLSTFVNYCNGLTIQFENDSYGGTSYFWDFGVAGTNTDTSTSFEPSYTFPSNGTYNVTLVVKKNNECTDTAKMTVVVNEKVSVNFNATDSICFVNNSVNFTGIITNADNGTIDWNFGPNASQPTATGVLNVNNIVYDSPGSFPTTLTYNHPFCQADTTIPVLILPLPVADFDLPLNYECDGLTIQPINTSVGGIYSKWDFGIPGTNSDTSSQTNPTFIYTDPGFYTVTLITGSTGVCADTTTKTFEVYDDLNMAIQSVDSMCILDNVHDYLGIVSGPDIASYYWNFGPNATPQTASDTNVYGVSLNTRGFHTITLYGTYLQCLDSVQKQVFVYRVPEIGFSIKDGLQCEPFTAQFIDESLADAPIYYSWDFGNGQTSTLQNPSTTYYDTGVFEVTLTIRTDEGCVDTLTLSRNDLVHVRPNPTAGFTINRDMLDICDNEVVFTDASQGAVIVSYIPDDMNTYLYDVPSVYSYFFKTSGQKDLQQIVINEYQCRDTAYGSLYVQPFVVFLPNAFTPDGDQFNNTFSSKSALQAEEWHMRIFNRWGEMVFESFDQNGEWDGTYAGKKSPDGVYNYILELTACGLEDKYRVLKGHVVLIR